MRLREHAVTLDGPSVHLRPMIEDDWDILATWFTDPEVLWFSEGEDVISRPLEDVQGIYRMVSQNAFCFVIEVDGQPIGECWLQEMNLDRILARFADKDCRRIDIMIGEKRFWGRGHGTDAIRVLTSFGFEQEGADLIFGCGIADYNPRSLKAFEKARYRVCERNLAPAGKKAEFEYDVVLTKDEYFGAA